MNKTEILKKVMWKHPKADDKAVNMAIDMALNRADDIRIAVAMNDKFATALTFNSVLKDKLHAFMRGDDVYAKDM